MQILPYDPSLAPALAALYNELVVDIPHCCPVSGDLMDRALRGEIETPRGQPLRDRRELVAATHGRPLGVVALGVAPATETRPDEGRIAFFAQQRGERSAGQALLEAAEARLRELGVKRVVAFHSGNRCPFYHLENAYLSDRLEHIHALFGLNGYARVAGEVFLNWLDYQSPEPGPAPSPIEISLKWQASSGLRAGLIVEAHQHGERVGECVIGPCGAAKVVSDSGPAGDLAAVDRAAGDRAAVDRAAGDRAAVYDWCFVTWLGVSEPLRGHGLGRYLLRRALAEMRGVGYRHAAISTAWNNYRAMALYSNYGFRAVDWTYGLAKELDA